MAPHSSTIAWKIPWTEGLVGCSPWGHLESDTTKRLHFHFSLSCIGEGNGNPLQCSCLENPRDRGAWWAAIYGVPQSRTRLKRLSSSSNRSSSTRHSKRTDVESWSQPGKGARKECSRQLLHLYHIFATIYFQNFYLFPCPHEHACSLSNHVL